MGLALDWFMYADNVSTKAGHTMLNLLWETFAHWYKICYVYGMESV